MVLCIDDILLASSDVNLLNDTKRLLSAKFDMKDLGEALLCWELRFIVIDLETSLGYLREPISIVCLKDSICICEKLVMYLL